VQKINKTYEKSLFLCMKQLTLQIPDEQYDIVLSFLRTVPEVKVKKSRAEELLAQLTPAQRETWEDIKEAFEEYKLVREGKKQARPASEFLAELKAEGLL
jgi:hypothetical protein